MKVQGREIFSESPLVQDGPRVGEERKKTHAELVEADQIV